MNQAVPAQTPINTLALLRLVSVVLIWAAVAAGAYKVVKGELKKTKQEVKE